MNTQRKPLKTLTVKQTKLVQGIAEGKTKQEAAIEAGYGTTPGSASAIATETLKNPKIQEAMIIALRDRGIDIDTMIAPVAKALTAKHMIKINDEAGTTFIESEYDDLEMQLKGHDRAVRLLGLKNDDGSGGVTNNFLVLVDSKLDQYGFE